MACGGGAGPHCAGAWWGRDVIRLSGMAKLSPPFRVWPVEGHNHAKSLIVAALVMRTSNDRWTSPDPGRRDQGPNVGRRTPKVPSSTVLRPPRVRPERWKIGRAHV